MRKYLFILTTIILFVSCDCVQEVRGTIMDSETNSPIIDAKIYNKNKTWSETTTDDKGEFELSNVSGGFTCPPMTIIVEKENYIKYETTIESGGKEIIKLKKTNSGNKTPITYNKAIKKIRDIWEDYKTNEEAIESEENKIAMTKYITSLSNVTNSKDLRLLINIWNYYDPTDYSCRNKIYNVLKQNKQISIKEVEERMKNKMDWEGENLEGTEFKWLLKQLQKEE